MSLSREDNVTKRFYILNAAVSIALLIVIIVSILQFGAATFEGKRIVGIVLPGKETDVGWNKSQFDGLKSASLKLGFEAIAAEDVGTDKRSLVNAVDKLTQKGAKTVFFANTENIYEAANIANTHPSVSFYAMETEASDVVIRRYGIRYAEAYYLAGVVAGLKTRSKKLGFIAPHPAPLTHQIINAFAIGARRVNKDAEVLVAWTGAFKMPTFEEQAVRDMRANAVDIITYFADGATIQDAASRARIDFISLYSAHSSVHNIATIKVNWEQVYLTLFRKENSNIDQNYVGDMQDGSVNVLVNTKLNARHQAIFGAEAFEIENGKNVFTGPIKDNRGIVRVKKDEVIGIKSLNSMSYLAEGVRVLGN